MNESDYFVGSGDNLITLILPGEPPDLPTSESLWVANS